VEAHETHEIAEHIHEDGEEGHQHSGGEWFRRLAAIYVGVVAMLLAIASLGGSEATKEMLNANIQASDTYAFYQAKYIRQLHYQTAADQLELIAAAAAALPPDSRAKVDRLAKSYRDQAAQQESDPARRTGKKELLAKAQAWDHERDHAAAKIPNFEYAEALYQIAIVLGSVAIVAASPWLLGLSGALASLALLLTLNGYLLLTPLPGGEAALEVPAKAAVQATH
jgi:hypothetical protein